MKLSGIVFILAGCFSLGYFFIYRSKRKKQIAESVTGRGVIVNLVSQKGEKLMVYYPVIRFTTDAGGIVEFKSPYGSSRYKNAIGEEVEVFYDPSDPQKAEIKSFASQWLVVGCLL